jgi:hypothetical protein
MRPVLVPGLALATALAFACDSSGTDASHEAIPAFRGQALLDEVAGDAESFTVVSGEWTESLGDAPFYGLAFYARAARDPSAPASWKARAAAAHDRAVRLVTNADFVNGDLQQILMSGHGLVEYMAATGDLSDLPVLDDFVDRFDKLVSLIGWYVEVGGDKSWALAEYGPTSISALVGLLDAEYAYLVGGPRADERKAWAIQMAEHIDESAWNGSYYAFGAGRAGLVDYPNIAMIIFESRLYELTGDQAHADRAVAAYQALQPLKLPDGRYYSVYSAAEMGAKTTDYSTLSSQTYMMIALLLLYEITGRASYVAEMDGIAEVLGAKIHGRWCLDELHPADVCAPACASLDAFCVSGTCEANACQGGMLHHWIDGRPALPSDPTFFCSGCNLELLYALDYRKNRLSTHPEPAR